jgi:hypothetical protein
MNSGKTITFAYKITELKVNFLILNRNNIAFMVIVSVNEL